MKKWIWLLLFLPVLACLAQGREERGYVTTPEDRILAEDVLESLRPEAGRLPTGELAASAGRRLLGQPYVAGTLEETAEEKLCIYLTRTDCILFVESSLCLARTAKQDGDFEMFADELRKARYREGRVTCYEDRLHYTTEWALQGIARGVLEDVTKELGGIPCDHPVSYMSSHPDAYPRMRNPEAIRSAEERINAVPRYYIPKSRIGAALKGIRTGDILCLTTTVAGLDVSHVGMALCDGDGTVRLLHASTGSMEVVVDARPLPAYLEGRKSVSGIMVFRPL